MIRISKKGCRICVWSAPISICYYTLPDTFLDAHTMKNIIYACTVLHKMIVEDKVMTSRQTKYLWVLIPTSNHLTSKGEQGSWHRKTLPILGKSNWIYLKTFWKKIMKINFIQSYVFFTVMYFFLLFSMSLYLIIYDYENVFSSFCISF